MSGLLSPLQDESLRLLMDRALLDLMRERLAEDLFVSEREEAVGAESISGWLMRYSRAPRDAERPFSFTGFDAEGDFYDYGFQQAILDDPARQVVVRKAAQMGISEIMVRDCLARLNRHTRTTALYVLPSKEDVQDFSDSRIRPILEYSPMLRRLSQHAPRGPRGGVKTTDNTQRKQIGDSFLIIRGGWEYRQAQMVAADFLYLDEYDRLKENVIPSFENRLTGSKYKLQRAYSTPQYEGKGIDALFQGTDQKFWYDICWKCGADQIMGEENIHQEELEDSYRYSYVCTKCQAEMSPEKRSGLWRPTAKSKTNVSGYHVSQFMSTTMSAEELVAKREGGGLFVMQDYLNLTLGMPAKGGLQDGEIAYGEVGEHEARLATLTGEEVVLSIDWGTLNGSWAEVSVSLDGHSRKVLWIECFFNDLPSVHIERMQEIAHTCRATHIIADAGFGQHQAEAMRDMFPTRFWTIMTNSETKIEPSYFPKELHIIWGKLRCFKSHFSALSHKRVILPCESPHVAISARESKPAHELWIDHHKNVIIRPVPKADEKRSDQEHGAAKAQEVITSRGPIHLAAVSAYADVMWHWVRGHGNFEEKRQVRRRAFRVGVTGATRRPS